MQRQKLNELREKLESQLHESEDSLVKAASLRWTVENLGQTWPEIRSLPQLLEMHCDGAEEGSEDEMYESLQAEYNSWRADAKKHVAILVSRKLPLTLSNMELSFRRKLPGQNS